MFAKIYGAVENLTLSIGEKTAFVLTLTLIVFGIVLNVILSVFVSDFDRRKRTWYIIFGTAVCTMQGCVVLSIKSDGYFLIFNVGVFLFGLLPPLFIKTKDKKSLSEGRKLVKFIDEQIKKSVTEQNDGEELQPSPIKEAVRAVTEREDEKFDIDYTHVKNIMDRLDYLSLTTTERRQIKDLEIALNCAESGEYSAETKEKINDGLGALLKIMSKYGA